MPKRLNYQLSAKDLGIVEQAIRKEKDPRVVKRATGIRLLHQGHNPQAVAEMLLVTEVTVYSWHHRWQADRLEGLRDKPRSGRPRYADEDYRRAIAEALDRDPADYGYAFAIWTVGRLREHLAQETGKVLSYSRLREVMSEMGYVYRRPTETLNHAQDVAAREQAQALIEELKKEPGQTISSSSLWTKQP